jgi:hypothetical protein
MSLRSKVRDLLGCPHLDECPEADEHRAAVLELLEENRELKSRLPLYEGGLREAVKLLEGLQCENCGDPLSEEPSPESCHPDVGHALVTDKIQELRTILDSNTTGGG